MKKILSVVLVLAMVLTGMCLFTSCDLADAATVVQKAEEALVNTPHVMTISMKFNCENAELNAIFSAMTMEIPVTVDGENLSLSMNVGEAGTTTNLNMVIVDKVLYYNISVLGQEVKMKSTLSEQDYAEFIKENSASMPVNPGHFETLTLESKDGKKIITCSGISEEGRAALNETLGDTLSGLTEEMSLSDLSYVLTIANGKYESMSLNVTYTMTVFDEPTTVSMIMDAAFTYTDVAPITAPADADSYTDMDVSDLLG